jgi:SAM-dependent methyltransferase
VTHDDHVGLLREGVPEIGGLWADFGSGTGAFTLALADLLGPGGRIISIDRDPGALRQQEARMRVRFPAVTVEYRTADFTRPLDLPPLDGVVMANALHFQRDQLPVVQRIRGYLRPGGRLLLVEYDTDRGNLWVPYPLSYPRWEALAREAGFAEVRLLATRPSRFLGRIYSALSRTSE